MHNHRREHFFREQRRARAYDLILDRYIAKRLAQHEGQQSGRGVGAEVHALPGTAQPHPELRCAVMSY